MDQNPSDRFTQALQLEKTPTILTVLSIPHVFQTITTFLSTVECLNLVSTCTYLRTQKTELWNINRHLHRYVKHPLEFRALMAKHDAIVAGNDVLEFFLCEKFENEGDVTSGLDLYVQGADALKDFWKYLVQQDMYDVETPTKMKQPVSPGHEDDNSDYAPHKCDLHCGHEYSRDDNTPDESSSDDYDWEAYFPKTESVDESSDSSDEENLWKLRKWSTKYAFTHKRHPHLKITICTTESSPIAYLLEQWAITTLNYNFYTYSTAYSLFAYHTFMLGDAYMTKIHPRSEQWLSKYEKVRGWRFSTRSGGHWNTPHQRGRHNDICKLSVHRKGKTCGVVGLRRFGDSACWMIQFDKKGVDVLRGSPQSLLPWCTFTTTTTRYGLNDVDISFKTFSVRFLRGSIVADGGRNGWFEFLEVLAGKYGKVFDEQVKMLQMPADIEVPAGRLKEWIEQTVKAVLYKDGEVGAWWEMYKDGLVHPRKGRLLTDLDIRQSKVKAWLEDKDDALGASWDSIGRSVSRSSSWDWGGGEW